MGLCWCREKSNLDIVGGQPVSDSDSTMADYYPPAQGLATQTTVEEYVLQMVEMMESAGIDYDDQPAPLLRLHSISDSAAGWKLVVSALVSAVPLTQALGPSTITIIFEDCPLPSTHTVLEVVQSFGLDREKAMACHLNDENLRFGRNMLVVLGCVAEKYPGPVSTKLLTSDLIEYLCTFLADRRAPELVLHALISVEKFGKTKNNKTVLQNYFSRLEERHPLIPLERHHDSDNLVWRQVGFCARWLLDNMFFVPGRSLTYTTLDMSGTNAILDCKDTTDFLKISPDGLEARCDAHTFESVRCTFEVDEGCWYYEAQVYTSGVMQIGWATKETKFGTHEGYGIGDDHCSLSYDGSRRLLWHNASPLQVDTVQRWVPGDILGCLIDLEQQEAIFSLNGVRLPICKEIFLTATLNKMFPSCSEGFYAAASVMCFQAVIFNFGKLPFRYAPTDREFMTFNDHGILSEEDKQVIPRWLYMQNLLIQDEVIDLEAVCAICYETVPFIIFSPCRHSGVCRPCAYRLAECPVCRGRVWHYTVAPL